MRKFLTKNKKTILILAFLLLVACVAYGQTLLMYFWQDDSAQIFRLQHPIGQMGSFGPSIWADRGPYRYMVIPFVPFYKLFQLNPFGYFLIGLLTYFVAAAFFYAFAKELFKKRKIALISAVFFAAGYIGSDMLFRIINSWQSNIGLILSLLALFFYTKFIHENKWKFFLLALLFYLGAIELVFIRCHSLIASIIILEVGLTTIPSLGREKLKSIAKSLFRLAPFIFFFYFWYLQDQSFGAPGFLTLCKEIFAGNAGKMMPLFATIGNALFPSTISEKLAMSFGNKAVILVTFGVVVFFALLAKSLTKRKLFVLVSIAGNILFFLISYAIYRGKPFWFSDSNAFISGTLGLVLTFNILYTGILAWNEKENLGKVLIIGYVMLASQIFGYYIQYPTAIFSTTHRYLAFSIIGYSILYPALFSLWPREKLANLAIYLLIGMNLFLGVRYQAGLVKSRSIPTRAFYQTLLRDVPKIDRGAIFYFDVKDDSMLQRQFADFFSVGSMPESTALAIYYGLDRDDIVYLTNFDELVSLLAKDHRKLNSVYAFYYGPGGLVNNTALFRAGLLASMTGQSSALPLLLEFTAVTNIEKSQMPTPTDSRLELSLDQQKAILSYYESRQKFYQTAEVSSLSEWKYQEIPNILDGKAETSWRGHRIYWDDHEHDSVIVDLGKTEAVGRFIWTNWISSLTPTVYTIETSLDGKSWTVSQKVVNGSSRGSSEKVIEKITPVLARYVKMDITKTLTNDSPAISEIEAVESKFDAVDLGVAERFLNSPFSFINDYEELNKLAFNFGRITFIRVVEKTDKGRFVKLIPVGVLGRENNYAVVLPAGGTKVEDISIGTDAPLSTRVISTRTRTLTLADLERLGLIRNFSQN